MERTYENSIFKFWILFDKCMHNAHKFIDENRKRRVKGWKEYFRNIKGLQKFYVKEQFSSKLFKKKNQFFFKRVLSSWQPFRLYTSSGSIDPLDPISGRLG